MADRAAIGVLAERTLPFIHPCGDRPGRRSVEIENRFRRRESKSDSGPAPAVSSPFTAYVYGDFHSWMSGITSGFCHRRRLLANALYVAIAMAAVL